MNDPFVPGVGRVLSADIAVPDHSRVRAFYASVLTTGAEPRWRDDLTNDLGMPIVGVGERTEAYAHLPLQWMPHIQVSDVAASVERARSLGGQELVHGRDDAGASQWAVLRDPSGAAFGVLPVSPPPPAPADETERAARPRAGRIGWLDLTVADAAATRDFYRQVVGWSVEDVTMKGDGETYADYCMVAEDGPAVAGVCHARGVNADLPPVWLLYLPVGDLEESARRVEAEGGALVRTSRDDDGALTTAVIRDPAGAHLALVPG